MTTSDWLSSATCAVFFGVVLAAGIFVYRIARFIHRIIRKAQRHRRRANRDFLRQHRATHPQPVRATPEVHAAPVWPSQVKDLRTARPSAADDERRAA